MIGEFDRKLVRAAETGDMEALDYAWNMGGDVNSIEDGRVALSAAAFNGHEECVRYLLERGAEIDKQNSADCTALFCAASQGHAKIVRILLDAGADPGIRSENFSHQTPEQRAQIRGHQQVVWMLSGAKRIPVAARPMPPRYPRKSPAQDDISPLHSPRVVGDELITSRPFADRVLQEVFNFRAQERITLIRNGAAGPVEAVTRQPFGAMEDPEAVEKAFHTYQELGGTVTAQEALPAHIYKVRLRPGAKQL